LGHSSHVKKLPKVNYGTFGATSPNLVTLFEAVHKEYLLLFEKYEQGSIIKLFDQGACGKKRRIGFVLLRIRTYLHIFGQCTVCLQN
jgi:hypothetical protein